MAGDVPAHVAEAASAELVCRVARGLLCGLYDSEALDIGRVSYVGNYEFQLAGAVVALAKRDRLQLKKSYLEDFFTELSATSGDPIDVIRMAVDLANTLLAIRDGHKVGTQCGATLWNYKKWSTNITAEVVMLLIIF